jgi:hypothetical protein
MSIFSFGHKKEEVKQQPYLERVIIEKKELDEKRAKLREFLVGDAFKALAAEEQDRLKAQIQAMDTYSNILGERIDYATRK